MDQKWCHFVSRVGTGLIFWFPGRVSVTPESVTVPLASRLMSAAVLLVVSVAVPVVCNTGEGGTLEPKVRIPYSPQLEPSNRSIATK